ncbi:DUF881 domain-containing protein [Thermohalobacter berrensis]|uniref:Division initiation protein n=1 Tax=Thermohalobacter berrensis TaxID=99594 RepID=A0A419TA08_9FIRM|nr:DUF881 domain-containing protein [Thermohalobacter berrensis]RKD34303.1 hypothetical protein BET03_00275 [Thermohalobacter berrensis]
MKVKFKIYILIICTVFGLVLGVQIKQNNKNYSLVTLKSISSMQNEIKNTQKEIKNLKNMLDKKKVELKKYEQIIENKGSIVDVLEKELENMKMISGLEDVQGPGVFIIVEDNDDEIKIGDNPNYDIVHDIDVLYLINELKVAGAEAISVNGQRVLSNSEIKCGGPIIRINEHSLATPFVIKAIGDPKVLYAAVNAPNTYGNMLKEVYNIKIRTEISDNILIPRYLGDFKLEYAKPVKEGE